MTWGPAERDLADEIVHASSGAAIAAPATSVSDLGVLMREAALVVSGDTGPLHIAAAMGTPLVGLYGPTWPERNGPWDPNDVVISRAQRLRVPSQAPVPARCALHQRNHARRSGERQCQKRLTARDLSPVVLAKGDDPPSPQATVGRLCWPAGVSRSASSSPRSCCGWRHRRHGRWRSAPRLRWLASRFVSGPPATSRRAKRSRSRGRIDTRATRCIWDRR